MAAKFETRLAPERYPEGDTRWDWRRPWRFPRMAWRLAAPLVYWTEVNGGRRIVVPAGFVTDYASVPRIPILYLAAGGRGNRAGVVHDYLYSGAIDDVERDEADAIFHEALLATGHGDLISRGMWAAVRSPFGWLAWRRYRRQG